MFHPYYNKNIIIILDAWKSLSIVLKAGGHSLIPVVPNLIDLIWDDKPNPPHNNVDLLPLEFTGSMITSFKLIIQMGCKTFAY